ncbi:hypothetical protein [Streptomyces sp. NPDC056682]|uniref:hypothetical protein n=1 Tax=Streptomyces sp. NPDC056682 TaxID=3345909 RepID=UPI003684D792
MAASKKRLDADEERVTRAQRRLIALGAALVKTPFDTATHDQLLDFLTHDAGEALTSLRALEERPEDELRARIAELAGHHLLTPGGAA